MKAYIYKLECPITKQFYIGSRKFDGDPIDDNYMGSYSRWKPLDKTILTKEILLIDEFDSGSDIHKLEGDIIKKYIDHPLNMNCQIPSENTFYMHGLEVSNITKDKMRIAKIGKKHTDETKLKISVSKTGFKHTDETKEKWSIERKLKNMKRSEITKEKMSKSQTGKTHTEESKQKNRDKHLGKHMSEESKSKISNKLKGVPKTPETIEKMRLSWIKRKENKLK